MLTSILKKINIFSPKNTHILFCIPRNEGAMGPLPQFFALPFKKDGVIYHCNPERGLSENSQDDIVLWFKCNRKNTALKFSVASCTPEQFQKDFGRQLEKDYSEFNASEDTYFGFGNFGFCMGSARLEGDSTHPFFDLL